MGQISIWAEWQVQEDAAERFDRMIEEIIETVRAEEPGAYTFWGYRNDAGTTYHLYEGFDDFECARAHLAGEIGPVRKYVPLQNEVAVLSDLSLHGDLTPAQADVLTGMLGGEVFRPIAGFSR